MKKMKYKLLEWPSQSSDLNPIEMLWFDLQKQVHARNPRNIQELKQFCLDEWSKIPVQTCWRLVQGYKKHLQAVKTASVGHTKY